MSLSLKFALIVFSIVLALFVSVLVAKGKIPIKYSLLWYAFAALILLVSLIPNVFDLIGRLMGFNVMADLVIGIILAVLIFLNIALTVMIASQRHRINCVSQEVALLKKRMSDIESQNSRKNKSKGQLAHHSRERHDAQK